MKIAAFGSVLLVGVLPAFGQVDATPPTASRSCDAAWFAPGIPSSVIVIGVLPATVAAASGARFNQPGGTRSTTAASGIASGVGTISAIGSIATAGIGTMRSSGVGHMDSSGVGSIGMGGIGSIGRSNVGAGSTPTSSSLAAPQTQSQSMGSSSARTSPSAQPPSGTPPPIVFVCR